MTVMDNYLKELAKSTNGESHVYPGFDAVSTTAITTDVTDTSLSGEIGSRLTLTGTRTDSQVQWSGLRLSTDVVDTSNGDTLRSLGMLSATSSGTLLTEQSPFQLLHTASFEIEFINNVIFRRP